MLTQKAGQFMLKAGHHQEYQALKFFLYHQGGSICCFALRSFFQLSYKYSGRLKETVGDTTPCTAYCTLLVHEIWIASFRLQRIEECSAENLTLVRCTSQERGKPETQHTMNKDFHPRSRLAIRSSRTLHRAAPPTFLPETVSTIC